MSGITRERAEELAREILPVDLNPWTVDIDTAPGLRRLLLEERRRVAEEIAEAVEEFLGAPVGPIAAAIARDIGAAGERQDS